MLPPRIDQNPELIDDFSNIWKTLEKIKSVEDTALSAGDFKRATANPIHQRKTLKEENKKTESNGKKKIYQYILEIISLVIGWILKTSISFLEFSCKEIMKILVESFNKISQDLQRLSYEHEHFQTIALEFLKNLNVEKVGYLTVIIFLAPLFVIIKVLYIILKFLVYEIPFE